MTAMDRIGVPTIGLEAGAEVVRMRQSRREPMRMRAPTALALLALLGGIGTARAVRPGDTDIEVTGLLPVDRFRYMI